jgi:hypothetical protein
MAFSRFGKFSVKKTYKIQTLNFIIGFSIFIYVYIYIYIHIHIYV